MTIDDLPIEHQYFTLVMGNGDKFLVGGVTKNNILKAKAQFIELPSGETINKSFISHFKLDKPKTRDEFLKLPYNERKQIADYIEPDTAPYNPQFLKDVYDK